MSSSYVKRPGSVTVVVVLVWISAILEIIGGVLLLVLTPTVRNQGNATWLVFALGILVLLIGLITAAVASRLSKGGNGARILVAVLTVLQIIGALTTLFTVSGSTAVSQAVFTLVLDLVILALLWNNRANRFFGTR
jgi:hypothetical protein